MVPHVPSFFANVEHIDAVEGLVRLVDLLESYFFETASFTRRFVGQGLPDDLLESVMMHSEDEDSLEPLFQRILHDIIHDSLAGLIKPSTMVVDHILELVDTIREDLEDISNIPFEILKLWIVQMHNLEVGENLEHLLVEVLDHGIHEENGS